MKSLFLVILSLLLLSCGFNEKKEKKPSEVLKEYIIAFKKGDSATMKALLSRESIKMAQQEAQVRSIPLDEVIKEETLFAKDQKKIEYRNERIEEDKAQIEVKTPYETWETIFFVKEDGRWKIAKERFVEENLKKSQEGLEKLERDIQQYFPSSQ
jgi:uncharacterized lipoprotein NlpE involved in copper resistance